MQEGVLIHIEYYSEFIVLAEELNFHSAAERLHLSQSALSKHLAELERYHGARLLERDRNSVHLTAKGAVFLEQAAELAALHEKMRRLFMQEDGQRPLVVSGVLDNPTDFPLVSLLLARCQQAGLAKLPTFLPCESVALADQVEGLRTGEADCALILTAPDCVAELPEAEGLRCHEVFRIPMDIIVRRDHPLAERSALTLDDLNGQTIIRIVGPRFTTAWNQLSTQLDNAGIHVKTKLMPASSAYESINWDPEEAALPAQRTAAFTVPMQHGSCVRIPVADDQLSLPLTAIYPAHGANPDLDLFLTSLTETYQEAFGA